jgi:hypothetical protein
MVPVIYTTTGVAIGHRPEPLAESRGLRSAGVERIRVHAAHEALLRLRSWLDTMLIRVSNILQWLVLEPWNSPTRSSTLR